MLTGKVVVVPLGTDPSTVARTLARHGATVVLVGDSEEAGRVAAEIQAAGTGRVAVFSDPDGDGLAEFLDELFRASSP
jgi:NAD(P)-dependent dehydrogenase (short-subunit alcohol dehydrogenase family)